jgi:hypothetical protein
MPRITTALRHLSCLVAAAGLVAVTTPTAWAQDAPSGAAATTPSVSVPDVPSAPAAVPSAPAAELPSIPAVNPAHQTYTSPQPASNADFSDNGANTHGAYDSTRSGAPALNGNGGGAAVGKPCAGCVGKADNKNPAGQLPNGSDPNAGYECDRNHGIGRTNPAHTGCLVSTSLPPSSPVTLRSTPTAPETSSLGLSATSSHQSNVASTGAQVHAALNAAILLIVMGIALALLGRRAPHGSHAR